MISGPELTLLIELIKHIGFPALIFIVFFLYHKSQTKILIQIIQNIEQREKDQTHYLKEQIETLQWMVSSIARLEYKIDAGMQCPMKKELLK